LRRKYNKCFQSFTGNFAPKLRQGRSDQLFA